MYKRNIDLNQFKKSNNFGVSKMDQNRVENRKVMLCRVLCFGHNLAIRPPN